LSQQDQPSGQSEQAKPRRAFRLMGLLIGVTLGFAATEAGLQILNVPQQMYSGWRSRAPQEQLNQLGYRGHKIVFEKDDFVVVLLGDSQAEGWRIPMDRMPEVMLQTHLRKLGVKRAKVFTVGCEGYGYDQQLLALTEYFKDCGYRADLVVQWQTPYNDLWENILVNQWMEASISKPTFALQDGKLIEPKITQLGKPLLSRVKLVAAAQKMLDQDLKLSTSDDAWEDRYLPAPYKPIVWAGPVTMRLQEAWDVEFGWIRWENFANEKSNFTIGLMPTSPRSEYAIRLANALLKRIRNLTESHGARFISFDVKTRSGRLWGQPLHMEPQVYQLNGNRYRFSFTQEYENVRKMNQGLDHEEIKCELDDWRADKTDWHLNEKATDNVLEQLAEKLVKLKLAPAEPSAPSNATESIQK